MCFVRFPFFFHDPTYHFLSPSTPVCAFHTMNRHAALQCSRTQPNPTQPTQPISQSWTRRRKKRHELNAKQRKATQSNAKATQKRTSLPMPSLLLSLVVPCTLILGPHRGIVCFPEPPPMPSPLSFSSVPVPEGSRDYAQAKPLLCCRTQSLGRTCLGTG